MKKSLSIFCIILIAFSTFNFCFELTIDNLEKSENFKLIDINSIMPKSDLMPAESNLSDGEPDENIINDIEKQYSHNVDVDDKEEENNVKNSVMLDYESPSELLSNMDRYEKLISQNVKENEIEDVIKKEKSNRKNLPKRVVPSQEALDTSTNLLHAFGTYKTVDKMWYYRRPFDKHSQKYTNIKRDQKKITLPQRMKELQITIQFNAGINFLQNIPGNKIQGIVTTLFMDDIVIDQQKFYFNGSFPNNSQNNYDYFILRGSMFNVPQGLHTFKLEIRSLLVGYNRTGYLQLNYYGSKIELSLIGYPDLSK